MSHHDRSHPPGDAELRRRLGPSYTAFRSLLDTHPDLVPEWKWYGQKNGWSLKLLDGRRSLCFVHPADGCFTVGFTLGHDATQRALAGDLPTDIRSTIAGARTSAEGRPFRMEVRSEDQLGAVHSLIEIKRGPAREPQPHRARQPRGRGSAARAPSHPPIPPRPDQRAASKRRGRTPG